MRVELAFYEDEKEGCMSAADWHTAVTDESTHIRVELVGGPAEEDNKGRIDGSVVGERSQLMCSAVEGASTKHLADFVDSPSNRLETDKVGCVSECRQEWDVQDDICLEWTIDEGDGRMPREEAVEENETRPEDRGDALCKIKRRVMSVRARLECS